MKIEDIKLQLTGEYEFGKKVGEFMTCSGECIGVLKLGRFRFYLDADGDGKFTYKRKTYTNASELTPEIRQKIRDSSPEIRWVSKPTLLVTLEMDGGWLEESEEMSHPWTELRNPLATKVALTLRMVKALRTAHAKNPFMTPEELELLDIIQYYRQNTIVIRGDADTKKRERLLYERLANHVELFNVLSGFEAETHLHPSNRSLLMTIAWASASEAAGEELPSFCQDIMIRTLR